MVRGTSSQFAPRGKVRNFPVKSTRPGLCPDQSSRPEWAPNDFLPRFSRKITWNQPSTADVHKFVRDRKARINRHVLKNRHLYRRKAEAILPSKISWNHRRQFTHRGKVQFHPKIRQKDDSLRRSSHALQRGLRTYGISKPQRTTSFWGTFKRRIQSQNRFSSTRIRMKIPWNHKPKSKIIGQIDLRVDDVLSGLPPKFPKFREINCFAMVMDTNLNTITTTTNDPTTWIRTSIIWISWYFKHYFSSNLFWICIWTYVFQFVSK